MEDQTRAYLHTIAVVLIWATVASAFKLSLRYLEPPQLVLYASVVSSTSLFLILAVQRKVSLLARFTGPDYLRSALLGLLNPFIYYLILFRAYARLPAQEALPLNYTWPIMLVLLSIPLLKQRIGLRAIASIAAGFAGVLIIATRGDLSSLRFTDAQGVFLALASAVIWALFWISNIRDRRDEIARLFLNFAFGSGFILAFTLLIRGPKIPPMPGLLGALYVGLFEMGITFVLWLKALRLSRSTAQVSGFIYLIPFLSLVVIRLTVGERILPSTLAGLVFIVAGIIGGRAAVARLEAAPPSSESDRERGTDPT
jgi:drug/metabolite transporter (DMT)-like permease